MTDIANMHAEKVIQRGSDEEAESLRIWTWFAAKQAGGTVVVSYNEFLHLVNAADATLNWSFGPDQTLTIVAT